MKRKSLEGWVSRILPLDVSFDGLTQEDVDSALLDHRPVPLLFGRISAATILHDLKARGLESRLAERGYHDFRAELPQVPINQEELQISAAHRESTERQKLMELKAFWGRLPLPGGSCRALVWDWLELRDPMAEYPANKPPLPGQTAPGLAMFHELVELMRFYVGQTDAEALVTIPQYFHNAVLYQKDPGLQYRFLDPVRQGQMTAQMRDLFSEGSLYSASWAFAENRVEALAPGCDEWTGFAWTPSELVLALTPGVKDGLDKGEPRVEQGAGYRFRVRSTPHPDIEGSFHLAG